MTWTFGTSAFRWLLITINGLPAVPTWNRAPRLVVRPLLGSGDADIAHVGYQPWRLQGQIWVAQAHIDGLLALNGEVAILSDGSTSWAAILELTLSRTARAADGATGQATFTRGSA